jgi:hypothetical protein
LGKKLSKTDLAMCSRPREADPIYDNKVKSPRKEPEPATNHKVLNIIKIYKNVLNRLNKTFNLNDSSNNLSSPNYSIIKSNENELLTKSQQQLVNKSTQTQTYAQNHSSPVSHKSLYSSTSSSASTSATSSNYNNKQLVFEENKDELFDLECDLEVASYFDRNIDHDHIYQQKNIYNKKLNSNDGYCKNDYKHLFSSNNFKTYVNNNHNNNYYHYYYNNYLNKENLSDFGTLC